ncbi:hypothetical protein L211DRAFT_850624 [Terfezia boudieri ATCC MYA-4762]|uniref:Uncharacterized protein n=1 Tax=Terfezia boudieri ATCC MYA-4762 TaxID=1051890 RepID=A0A3N4LI77_9PEZI|nr:hypothetical protein L211DRAFT_850624 [Terfezia boudieri ATCC MYA-4762]
MIRDNLKPIQKTLIHDYIDLATEKVTKYWDIAPRAHTLKKLRDGKVQKEKKSTKYVGEARVLTHKYVNDELKKNEEAAAAKVRRQQAAIEKKRIAEEKKAIRDAVNMQWKVDLQRYQEVEIPAWQVECIEIDKVWAIVKTAVKGLKRIGRKPTHPPRPK